MKRTLPCFILSLLVVSANGVGAQENSAPMPGASNVVQAAPGPFLEKREKLLSKIIAARQAGCGVAPYMNEFNRIESALKDGQSPDTVSKEVDSLTEKIEYQLSRISIIRSQRPVRVMHKPEVVPSESADEKTASSDPAKTSSGNAGKTSSKGSQTAPSTSTAKSSGSSNKSSGETGKLAALRQIMKDQYADRYNDKMTDDELVKTIQDDPRLNYLLDQIPGPKGK